jgi:myo-inositol-1(or 4)-monophosphatase
MGDVFFGYVYDFGSGEEWVGRRGEVPSVNGRPVSLKPRERIEILSFEATRASLIAQEAPKVADLAYRLRVMGSLALSLAYLSAGRVDAVCSLKPARSVDIAAAQLFVREAGLAIELFDDERPFVEAELDVEGRAGTARVCGQVVAALRG